MNGKTNEGGWKKRIMAGTLALMVVALGVVAGLCATVWQDYRNTVIENQKEQMLLTTRAVCRSMNVFFEDVQAELSTLARSYAYFQQEGKQQVVELLFDLYALEHGGFVFDLRLTNREGAVLYQNQEEGIQEVLREQEDGQGGYIRQVILDDGRPCLAMGQSCGEDRVLWLLVDLANYYEDLISGIQVGTNGYIMVKNSQGIILMHPDQEQWGIHVIQGRRELYPGIDLSSLEGLVAEQNQGGSGVMEYDSYWWMDPEMPRVRKVSAWAPVQLGEDFLVVSTVIDDSDIDIPIGQQLSRMGILVLSITLLLLVLSFSTGKLLLDRRRSAQEIAYLRELNELLEQLHRSEEVIAHQQRLQIIGTMTGGIAHEFNNLLTPILGHADLLQLEVPEDSDAYESVREISDAAVRCKEMIQQLSSLSRKNVEAEYQPLPAGSMFGRILKMVRSVCPSYVQVQCSLDLGDARILGNETQLQQVILNICVNAFQAMAGQEGTLTVTGRLRARQELEKACVVPEGAAGDTYVQLDLADTGYGMSSDTLEQIFDPFFTTKPAGQGTGLGLSLAQQIIHAHRGMLYAESRLGQGSVFHLLLPVMGAENREASEMAENGPRSA